MVAPQYITLGGCTAVPVTHWEITLRLWWKWLPCRKKIKAVDRWMVTGWSLIIREMGLVTLHGLENDMAATAVGQNNLFCYWSRRPLLRYGNWGGIFCTDWRPQSYQCPFIKKAASEDTGLCSVISCSLFIPFRSWAVTGLPSNALGCLTTVVWGEVESVLTA